ncbi:hypothetical protein C2E23DRAFT_809047 [Lenzites betulinus]|nr:hypothetical protein C2E23DRAFT_809047 [Lenzites betulinus]
MQISFYIPPSFQKILLTLVGHPRCRCRLRTFHLASRPSAIFVIYNRHGNPSADASTRTYADHKLHCFRRTRRKVPSSSKNGMARLWEIPSSSRIRTPPRD